MTNIETSVCGGCYQQVVCEMNGDPRYVGGILDGDQEIPQSPAACFFHCCRAGVKDALEKIKEAKKTGTTGLIPVSTPHKPYITIPLLTGREVAYKANGWGLNDGDVVIRSAGKCIKLTNVFLYHPPK